MEQFQRSVSMKKWRRSCEGRKIKQRGPSIEVLVFVLRQIMSMFNTLYLAHLVATMVLNILRIRIRKTELLSTELAFISLLQVPRLFRDKKAHERFRTLY